MTYDSLSQTRRAQSEGQETRTTAFGAVRSITAPVIDRRWALRGKPFVFEMTSGDIKSAARIQPKFAWLTLAETQVTDKCGSDRY